MGLDLWDAVGEKYSVNILIAYNKKYPQPAECSHLSWTTT